MSDRTKAWIFVGVQAVLLLGLWLTPVDDLWERPTALLRVADVVFWLGLAYAGVAALWLRGALTALPIPRPNGSLVTNGPYRISRHPIYLGVLAACLGMALGRASWIGLALLVATVVFFHSKARWEERHLAVRYPGYTEYAQRTGRILPKLGAGS
jgi:protein-S-isoprenylcysteine O-methyltransferase Ste14